MHLDCIFLKTILDGLKEGGFYQAYLKFTSGLQISNQMHGLYTKQRGGTRQSLMFFVIIILSMLVNTGAIQINSGNKYARQIIQDFRLYADDYDMKTEDPQTYFNLYFSKIATYSNSFGSCLYQSLAIGATPENLHGLHNMYKTHGTSGIFPSLYPQKEREQTGYITLHTNKANPGTTYNALLHTKRVCFNIYSLLNDTYHNAFYTANIVENNVNYFAQLATPKTHELYNEFLEQNKDNSLEHNATVKRTNDKFYESVITDEIAAIKSKLRLSDLMGENLFGTNASEPVIITIPAFISGHAFNFLYNTKNEKIGIYDYNHLQPSDIINHIKVKDGVRRKAKLNIIEKIDSFIWSYLSNPGPMYILEPGFWDDTNFDSEINTILSSNTFNLIKIKTIIQYSKNPIDTYMDIVKRFYRADIPDYIHIQTFHIFNHHSHKFHNEHRNVFQGWGCMTLNNCAESAIAFIETYADLLENGIHNSMNTEINDHHLQHELQMAKKHLEENRAYATKQQQELSKYLYSKMPTNKAANEIEINTRGGCRRRVYTRRRRNHKLRKSRRHKRLR